MGGCRHLGSGRVGTHMLLSVVAVSLFVGCVSQETIKHREQESDGYYKQGLSSMTTNQQQAFVAFQKALQINPDNYDARYALATIYFLREEYADAEREFQRCLELMPDKGEALNFYGRTLMRLKRYPEAIEILRKASTNPLYATPDIAFFNLAQALEVSGDVPGAIRAYQDALKIDPPNIPRALLYLAVGRLYMQQGEDAKAREALAQVKNLDPQGPAGAEASKMMKQLR